MSTMGEQIKQAREVIGMTQIELARRMDCAEFTIRRWEKGGAKPLPIYRKKLEQVLKIKLEEEQDANENKKPSPGE